MKIQFATDGLEQLRADLLGLSAFEGALAEAPLFAKADQGLGGLLSELVEEEGFSGKEGQSLMVHTHSKIGPKRVLVVGLGKRETFELPDTRRYAACLMSAAQQSGARRIAATLPPIDTTATERASQFLAEGLLLAAYRFDQYLSEPPSQPLKVDTCDILLGAVAEPSAAPPQIALARAELVANAVCLARELTNEPGGELTPTQLAERATALAAEQGLDCKVFGPRECAKQKMGLFLAVSRGSTEEPRFIHLSYRPRGKDKPTRRIVLVGKGVTFDSGGLSLKPTASMLDMKCDMAGAAAVVAVMGAVAKLGLQSEVHGLIAATENMISGSAYKLGDIVTGMAGKSVEITNTDAEGRLTLADALAYGVQLKPDEIIDMATLTGACLVALGPHMAGVMGNDVSGIERFLAAARRAGEDVWQLPLTPRLRSQLESKVADMKNAGDRWGGAMTAGLFLKEFVGDVPWLHIDIAGPAYAEKPWGHIPHGGTGFGVAALIEYLLSRDGARAS